MSAGLPLSGGVDQSTPSVTDFNQYAKLRAGAQANDPKALRAAAQQFEALFTQMMLKSMRATHFGDDLTGGQEGQVYQDMYDQQLSMHLSSGRGIGLADMLVRQLQQGQSATALPATPQTSAARGVQTTSTAAASGAGDSVSSADATAFVNSVQPYAQQAAQQLGVPARALIAQAALETGWGKHMPRDASGRSSFNLFGIKAGGAWQGDTVSTSTQEFSQGAMNTQTAQFRAYGSVAESFADYVHFLKSNPRYADALRSGSDTQSFAQGLQSAGYATDPDYARKITTVAYSAQVERALGSAVPHPASGTTSA